jgi:HD domain
MLLELIETASPDVHIELTPYVQRALRLIACRCLGGLNRPNETALGLSPGEFKSFSYASSLDVVGDLEKLVGKYDMSIHVPELDLGLPERIQVSNLAPVVLTPRLRRLLRSPRFIYLSRVSQLGLIQLVYPTATHTRREHALGTYAMACEYVRWLLRDETNPFFSQVITPTNVKALLLAALLHDLGHFPLAHDFEEADRYLFDHEVVTKQILLTDSTLRDVIEGDEPEGWAVPVERVESVLRAKEGTDAGLVDRLLHSVISGPLDADKMDYLARDSLRTGTAYGRGIDVKRLSTTLTVVLRPSGPTTYAAIGTQEKGMGPAETVAFARYTMFRSVYWHHSYRAIKSMLQFMVLDRMRYAFLADGRHYRSRLSDAIVAFMETTRMNLGSVLADSELPGSRGVQVSSVLPYAEDSVIRWCVEDASQQTVRMYEVLSRGEWYKRLVVLSLGRDLREAEAERLGIIYSDTAQSGEKARQWMRRFLFQRVLPRNIETRVTSWAASVKIAGDERRDDRFSNFMTACKREQVVLVDFPDPKRTLSGDLFYLVEEDYASRRVDGAAAFQSERSLIFHSISRDFMTSIGKLRVIIKQEHREFVHRVLTRSGIVAAVLDALNYVTSVQVPEEDELFRAVSAD